MTKKYSFQELVEKIKTPGWLLHTGQTHKPVKGTLEEILRVSHERRKEDSPGLIEEIETSIELDMIQIEKLWRYIGLPV